MGLVLDIMEVKNLVVVKLDSILSAFVFVRDCIWFVVVVILAVDVFNEEVVKVADVSATLNLWLGVVLISSSIVDIVEMVVFLEMGATEVLLEVVSVTGVSVATVNEADVVLIMEGMLEGLDFKLITFVELERVEIVSTISDVLGMIGVNVVGMVSSVKAVWEVELDCLGRLVPVFDVTGSDSDTRLVLEVASANLEVVDMEVPI